MNHKIWINIRKGKYNLAPDFWPNRYWCRVRMIISINVNSSCSIYTLQKYCSGFMTNAKICILNYNYLTLFIYHPHQQNDKDHKLIKHNLRKFHNKNYYLWVTILWNHYFIFFITMLWKIYIFFISKTITSKSYVANFTICKCILETKNTNMLQSDRQYHL